MKKEDTTAETAAHITTTDKETSTMGGMVDHHEGSRDHLMRRGGREGNMTMATVKRRVSEKEDQKRTNVIESEKADARMKEENEGKEDERKTAGGKEKETRRQIAIHIIMAAVRGNEMTSREGDHS